MENRGDSTPYKSDAGLNNKQQQYNKQTSAQSQHLTNKSKEC